jgi:hemerythrin
MTEAAWDASLETGNELIDSQHRELNAFVNELREAGINSDDDYLQVLDKVMDFALFHFDAEEKLMTEVGYPPDLTQEMVEQHKEFKSYARQCVLDFHRGDMRSVEHLQTFAENFLKAHEVGEDKKLADWIRDNDMLSAASNPQGGL